MNITTDFTGAGVSVDPATGELRIPTSALRDGLEVIVTAIESGVTSRYRIGVVAEPAPAAPEESGTVEPETGAVFPTPTATEDETATVEARSPAEPVGLGATVRKRTAPAGFPDFPASQIALAKSSAVVNYNDTYVGTGGVSYGFSKVVLGYMAWRGDTSCDSKLVEQIRASIHQNTGVTGQNGGALMAEVFALSAMTFGKLTSRIWNSQLTAAERTKVDLAVKGLLAGAAFMGSGQAGDNHSFFGHNSFPQGNTNWKSAISNALVLCRIFLGSDAAVTSFLQGFDVASFRSQLTAQKMNNMAAAFALSRSNSPTASQVNSALNSSTRYQFNKSQSFGLTEWEAHLIAVANSAFPHPCANGFNRSDNRGEIMSTSGRPAGCALGKQGMAQEFDAAEAGGDRSCMSYVVKGTRPILSGMLAMMAAGLLDRTKPGIQALKPRMHVGMLDMQFKHQKGYRSYSAPGSGPGNEDWVVGGYADKWVMDHTFGAWFDVIKPWLDGA